MPMVGVKPGSAPTVMPTTVPIRANSRLTGEKAVMIYPMISDMTVLSFHSSRPLGKWTPSRAKS